MNIMEKTYSTYSIIKMVNGVIDSVKIGTDTECKAFMFDKLICHDLKFVKNDNAYQLDGVEVSYENGERIEKNVSYIMIRAKFI